MSQTSQDLQYWLLDRWVSGFAAALEGMSGDRPAVRWEGVTADAVGEAGKLWWQQPFSAGPDALVFAGAPEPTWNLIGSRLLLAAGIDDAEPADSKDTYLEVLRQSLAALASELGGRLGREVLCEAGAEAGGAPGVSILYPVEVRMGDQPPVILTIGLTHGLLTCLEPPEQPAAAAPTPDSGTALPPTFEVLLDVEMPVSVCFGRARVRIQDALKLNTGSIIELDRDITEPVEVVVNNCVIARGEVVVIEGNYGVRISEIISRQERLRSTYDTFSSTVMRHRT